jgi:hypothetical protein
LALLNEVPKHSYRPSDLIYGLREDAQLILRLEQKIWGEELAKDSAQARDYIDPIMADRRVGKSLQGTRTVSKACQRVGYRI